MELSGWGETQLSCPNPTAVTTHFIAHSNGKLLKGKIDDANGVGGWFSEKT